MNANMRRIVLTLAAMLLWIMQVSAQTGGSVTGILKEKASGLPMYNRLRYTSAYLALLHNSVCHDNTVISDSILFVANKESDNSSCTTKPSSPYKFKPLQLVVPGTLIGVGIIGLESDWLKFQNREIRDELQENIDHRLTIDDFTQYAPMAATYGLNLCGIKGKHGYGNLTIILGTAYALMGTTVYAMKNITKVERPDGSARNSFPSGHTATAFMGAELLRREYWDVSPWIGIAGYAVAAGTGFFRMYNNRHWLTDVIAGAGIGILSVQAAYWLYPIITKTFFRKQYYSNMFLSPYVSSESKGVAFQMTF